MNARPSASGFRVLVFCGFALAGVLTVFLAFSLRSGDLLSSLIHAGLLWATVALLNRNIDNLAAAEGRGRSGKRGGEPGGPAAGPGPERS